jgi:butyryl-CoA dehydrogenase
MWLKQGVIAQNTLSIAVNEEEVKFYKSKIQTMKFYFEYELPKTKGLHDRLMSSERVTLETDGSLIL